MGRSLWFAVLLVGGTALHAGATTRFVAADSPAALPPYTNWATAAAAIQDAIDAADPGDTILVGDGVYATGGRAVPGTMTNRVAITKPVEVRSVNGPEFTFIVGSGPLGSSAVRCAYVTNGARLAGFTLTNGHTLTTGLIRYVSGGGLLSEPTGVASNCLITGCQANHVGGGSCSGTLYNCVLTGNRATHGGGAADGTLMECTLSGNTALQTGGGCVGGLLTQCVVVGNTAAWSGGGSAGSSLLGCAVRTNVAARMGGGCYNSMLRDCELRGNFSGTFGGGSYQLLRTDGILTNCVLADNTAVTAGGGVYHGTLYNCVLTGNRAHNGGGAFAADLYNCTLSGNTATYGGGSTAGTRFNSILYFNRASVPEKANWSDGAMVYCCTIPVPEGAACITNDPLLASASHIAPGSPCAGRGTNLYAKGVDVDGDPWADPPSIGCDEAAWGSLTGALTVAVGAVLTNVAPGWPLEFRAEIGGAAAGHAWSFGDGGATTNRPYPSHAWTTTGSYPVTLRAWNDAAPDGVVATAWVNVVSRPIHHVQAAATGAVAPYLTWETAASNIQDAVDTADAVGALVWVSNGVYEAGGRAAGDMQTSRVAVLMPIEVRSVNGPGVTVIAGSGPPGTAAVRCAYVTNGALLAGFTLTNGYTRDGVHPSPEYMAGGVWGVAEAVVSNCLITGCQADYAGGASVGGALRRCILARNHAHFDGGGSYYGTLDNCVLWQNSTSNRGGGSTLSLLRNCTLAGNSATTNGGGAAFANMKNCIVYYNESPGGTNWIGSARDACCTLPNPGAPGGITNAPAFVDLAGGDLRLATNSPCINAGRNQHAPGETDLDGQVRVVGGVVDLGAFERQDAGADADGDTLTDAWEMDQFQSLQLADGGTDYDGDRFRDREEELAGTDPRDPLSSLALIVVGLTESNEVAVTWLSASNRTYVLRASTNLPDGFFALQTNLPATLPATTVTDRWPVAKWRIFSVGVE